MLKQSMMLTLKYGAPIFLILAPALMIIGTLFPDSLWKAVDGPYRSQMPIMVSYIERSQKGSNQSCSPDGNCGIWIHYNESFKSITYLIAKPQKGPIRYVTVQSINHGPPVVFENPFEFYEVVLIAFCVLCALLSTWWFWIRN